MTLRNRSSTRLASFVALALVLTFGTSCDPRPSSTRTISRPKTATTTHASVKAPEGAPGEGVPFYLTPDLTPTWLDEAARARADLHRIPSFRFTDQEGREVTEKSFAGKICVVDFFFTTCGGICPKLTTNLKVVQDEFADSSDVALLSHTVTPKLDTVGQLAAYGEARGVNPERWKLVTGSRDEIYRLARESYFAEGEVKGPATKDHFLHTEKVFLLDGDRRIRGVYDGTRAIDMRLLIEDIRELRKESAPDDEPSHS